MLVNTKTILQKARAGGYAVPAFNITDLQSIMVISQVCEEEQAPCLIEAAEATVKAYGADYLAAMAKVASERISVPMALHLDHGYTFDILIQGIRAGFSSVMLDESSKPMEENIKNTKRIVEIAHACAEVRSNAMRQT